MPGVAKERPDPEAARPVLYLAIWNNQDFSRSFA